MINDAITLGSFMADLMEWYCKLVEADHLQDYEIDRNYEKLNVRQMLIDDAIAEIGTILSYFDSDTVKSMFSEFKSNETAAKYQEQIIRAIKTAQAKPAILLDDIIDSYTAREFAEKLGVSEITIQRKLASGDIKAKKIGRSWKISKSELELIKAGFKRKTSEEIAELSKSGTLAARKVLRDYFNTIANAYGVTTRFDINKKGLLIEKVYINGNIVKPKSSNLTDEEYEEQCGVEDFCYLVDLNIIPELKGRVYRDQ